MTGVTPHPASACPARLEPASRLRFRSSRASRTRTTCATIRRFAAIPGFVDFFTIRPAQSLWVAWAHMIGNLTVVVLALINVWLRWRDPAAGVMGWGLTLSFLQTALLLINGWLGGELAYRYRIGTTEDESPEVMRFHADSNGRLPH